MPRLRLETATDALDLDEISEKGSGVEALAGVTGLGLPPVTLQWAEGAGDGAVFRSRRVQPRVIDIPVYIHSSQLGTVWSRLTRILAQPVRVWFIEDNGDSWYVDAHRAGGGDYAYGIDTTGEFDLRTVVTLRAGDPYWTSAVSDQRTISRAAVGRGLIKDTTGGSTGADSLVKLRVSSSQVQGAVLMENSGDVEAYPVWEIHGPGSHIVATGPNGDVWNWTGSLADGDVLTIDSRTARAIDDTGASRYSQFDASPRFWTVPHGISTANVTMLGTGYIVVTWQRRKWAVI